MERLRYHRHEREFNLISRGVSSPFRLWDRVSQQRLSKLNSYQHQLATSKYRESEAPDHFDVIEAIIIQKKALVA